MRKKLMSIIMIGALTSVILPTQSALALDTPKTGTKAVTVTYNNQTVLTDPDKPGAPEWAIVIPSGINFAEDKKTVSTELAIQKADGTELAASDNYSVDVSVTSKNDYKLKMVDGQKESSIDYTLSYGTKTMSDTLTQIGTLNHATPKLPGTATLADKGVASLSGNHSDTLTYTVATHKNTV